MKTGTGPIERIVSSNTKKEGGFNEIYTKLFYKKEQQRVAK